MCSQILSVLPFCIIETWSSYRCSHCSNISIEEHNFPLGLVLINKGRDVYWNAIAVWVSAIWRPPEHLCLNSCLLKFCKTDWSEFHFNRTWPFAPSPFPPRCCDCVSGCKQTGLWYFYLCNFLYKSDRCFVFEYFVVGFSILRHNFII